MYIHMHALTNDVLNIQYVVVLYSNVSLMSCVPVDWVRTGSVQYLSVCHDNRLLSTIVMCNIIVYL